MRLKLLFLSLAFSLAVFSLPWESGAASPASIGVSLAPENPSPKETVIITLSSYVNNLDSVSISWSVDGKTASVGIGKKIFSAVAPEAGKEMRVTATIALPDGTLEKTVVIRPAVMALLWQANDSYVPPFYKGKALPIVGSEVKVVAMPEVKTVSGSLNPKNMVYAWKKNYTNDSSASGYGKNSYIYNSDYLENSASVGVTASSTDGKYSSAGNLAVSTFEPQILFYRVTAEKGTIWEQALSDGHRIEGEEIITAAPYYISPKDVRAPSFSWAWSINNARVGVPEFRPNFLPLQAQAGVSGRSNIGLKITNKYNLLTSAEKELSVEF